MKITRYNISKPRKYTNKNGDEKTQWNNIGTMTEFHKEDGKVSRIIEIPAIGLEANLFKIEPKERENTRETRSNEPIDEDAEINAEDIPF